MSTTTLAIPQKQADQLSELANAAHVTTTDFFAVLVNALALARPHPQNDSLVMDLKAMRDALAKLQVQHDSIASMSALALGASYTREQFMSDLAAANSAGDEIATETTRRKARATSLGAGSAIGRTLPDGVTYQKEMRDAW